MSPQTCFAHAAALADELTQYLGRTTRPKAPHGTDRDAANDPRYLKAETYIVVANADGQTTEHRVIATSPLQAHLAVLDMPSTPVHASIFTRPAMGN